MEENTSFLLTAALIINFIIMYFIIESATRSKAIKNYHQIQIRLLMKMAEKSGVTKEEVLEAVNYKSV
jgi:hypothetical protein